MVGNVHLTSHLQPSSQHLLIQALLGLGAVALVGTEVAFAQAPKPTVPASTLSRPLLKTGSQGEAVTELQAMLKLLGYYGGSVNGTYDEATATAVTKFQKSANLSADGVVGAETWNRLLPPSPTVTTTATKPANTTPPKSNTAESFPLPGGTKPSTNTATSKPATAAPTTKPATTAANSTQSLPSDVATLPILRLGMKGPAVEGLQERLRSLGFLKGAVDGIFGTETQAAVKAAQRKFSLEPDGVVGNATWMGLLR